MISSELSHRQIFICMSKLRLLNVLFSLSICFPPVPQDPWYRITKGYCSGVSSTTDSQTPSSNVSEGRPDSSHLFSASDRLLNRRKSDKNPLGHIKVLNYAIGCVRGSVTGKLINFTVGWLLFFAAIHILYHNH